MAATDTIIVFFVILITTLVASTQAAQFCNNGSDINDPNSLLNQTCSSLEIHLPGNLFVTDHRTTSSYREEEHLDFRIDEHVQDYMCFISRVVSTKILKSGIKKESVHTEYGCDTSNLCRNMKLRKILYDVTVNGQTGQLYCCNTENCNEMNKIIHTSAENRICHHGNNSATETPSIELESCNHPDAMCARMTTFRQDKKLQSYFCDNEKVCQSQMRFGAYKSCQNTTTAENITQEMCCCDGRRCFNPPWKIISPDSDESSDNSHYSNKNTINKPGEDEDDKLVVTGLVAAVVLIICIGAGIIFVVACKRRKRPQRDPNVIMQYEKLSASDPEMEEAVVL